MENAIFIRGLRVCARHALASGEAPAERQFEIDLDMGMDLSRSSRTDCLSDTICYASVVASANDAFCSRSYQSLEGAASALANVLLTNFPPIRAIKVTVRTLGDPVGVVVGNVGVTLFTERGRHQGSILGTSSGRC
jgi:7,8-dihydroneopterin aldolase/epimerase/oxygenase